jgi:hypothetical protein
MAAGATAPAETCLSPAVSKALLGCGRRREDIGGWWPSPGTSPRVLLLVSCQPVTLPPTAVVI